MNVPASSGCCLNPKEWCILLGTPLSLFSAQYIQQITKVLVTAQMYNSQTAIQPGTWNLPIGWWWTHWALMANRLRLWRISTIFDIGTKCQVEITIDFRIRNGWIFLFIKSLIFMGKSLVKPPFFCTTKIWTSGVYRPPGMVWTQPTTFIRGDLSNKTTCWNPAG